LSGNVNTVKKIQSLLEGSREVGLEVSTERTYYMVVSQHQNAGCNYNY